MWANPHEMIKKLSVGLEILFFNNAKIDLFFNTYKSFRRCLKNYIK